MSSASSSLTDKTMSHSTKDDRKSDHPIHDESTNPTEHSQDKPEPHIVIGGKSPSSSSSPPKSPSSSSSSSKQSQKVKNVYEKASEEDQKEKTKKEDETKPASKL